MNLRKYQRFQVERGTLGKLLLELPTERVIDPMGLEKAEDWLS